MLYNFSYSKKKIHRDTEQSSEFSLNILSLKPTWPVFYTAFGMAQKVIEGGFVTWMYLKSLKKFTFDETHTVNS